MPGRDECVEPVHRLRHLQGRPQPHGLPPITDADVIYAGQQITVPGSQSEQQSRRVRVWRRSGVLLPPPAPQRPRRRRRLRETGRWCCVRCWGPVRCWPQPSRVLSPCAGHCNGAGGSLDASEHVRPAFAPVRARTHMRGVIEGATKRCPGFARPEVRAECALPSGVGRTLPSHHRTKSGHPTTSEGSGAGTP